ncbi:M64 family metallopeptidase [Idiomarina aminovorans]|uniref:M64 family metallopeptidase n=1 Tax=Idiomarina aminovorans TaxID=2914829 RepID=UPI002005F6E8|nr:M64 family metallopeptidase [Idiomarina sp. ATCH4]MCK7458221.1 M64 family metallo-endopeptidase [Idiomarina sp. ATCH4]
MKRRLLILLVLLGVNGWSHQVYNQQQRVNWLAHKGNAKAQYQLANRYWHSGNRTVAYYWWQQSAEQQHLPAIESLIKEFPQATNDWLQLAAAAGDAAAQRQVAKHELANRNVSLEQWQLRWETANEPWLQRQIALLKRYQEAGQCEIKINVIASTEGEKERYLDFLSAVKSSPFDSENWCISWRLDQRLSCAGITERNRAKCNFDAQFDKHVVLADKGIASADNRTLILTPDSSEKVIQHELGHWMGFADEYEMTKSLAQKFCHGRYEHKSLNIIVTKQEQSYTAEQVQDIYQRLPWKKEINSWHEIASFEGDNWRLGSSENAVTGLFKADTCNAINGRQAWRPVDVSTAMEQHDTGLWPALYLKLLINPE